MSPMTVPGVTRAVPLPLSPRRPHSRRPALAALVGLPLVYLLGTTSVLFAPAGSTVAVWWPAAGVAVAMLLVAGHRWHAWLAAGVVVLSGLANLTGGRPVDVSLGFGLANAAEALVVAWLLARARRPALRTLSDLRRLLLATIAGNVVAGVGIGLTAWLSLGASFQGTALTVMASHAAAILVFAPLVLGADPAPLAGRRAEAVVQWVLLVVTVWGVFAPGQGLGLTFVPLPLLLWAALRFDVRTVSYQLITVGVLTSALTAAGGGPFAAGARDGAASAATTASLVQSFLIACALLTLPVVLAVDQRRTAMSQVMHSAELFRKAFSESFVGMLLLSLAPDGLRIRDLNHTAADILGGRMADLVGRPLAPLLDTTTSLETIAGQLRDGELVGWREETWLAAQPGRRVGLALSALSISDTEGMFSAQIIDVTDVHVASARLRTEKDFTAAVLNTTACLIVVVDLEGTIAGLNPAAARAAGIPEKRALGQPLWQTLVSREDEAACRALIDKTVPGTEAPTWEVDVLSSTDRRRRVVWTGAPLTDPYGERTHVVLTGIDVTAELNMRSITAHLLDAATTTAFIGLNLRGTVTIFNKGAERLLGYDSADVIGRLRLVDLHDPEELVERATETGQEVGFESLVEGVDDEPRTADWAYLRRDGSSVVCSVTISAVRDAFGAVIGYLAVGRDVTSSRRTQRILEETLEKERQALERLQELDRAKSDFVSMVSHELRTPITSIVGYTELLLEQAAGTVTDDQSRLLTAVRRNGERLIVLIEDLLTLSRIEAGTFTLEKSGIDLRSVVAGAREALGPMLSGRRLDVSFDLPGDPVPVLGDPGQLERVLLNLVGNAVKFTEDGGEIDCRLGELEGEALLTVSDTGIGIPEEEQGGLFEKFFRSSTAQDRAIQGTGLGLSIVASIVAAHGGRIEVRSAHLAGTTFTVRLPLRRPRG